MRILALDIGDRWTGSALSDPFRIIASPYKTIDTFKLQQSLDVIITQEAVSVVVVGYPKTLRGTESDQTKKVQTLFQELQQQYSDVEWVLWDERLTSQQAAKLKKTKTKEDKIKSHSIAAAFILESYLQYLSFQKEME